MLKKMLMLLLVIGLSIQIFGQTAGRGLEGAWAGTLEAGGAKLRLALTVTRSGTGTYAGNIDSLDQGTAIPIDVITVTGDAVRLELKAVGGVFEGALNRERTELAGKWSQGGDPLSLVFKRDSPVAAPAPAAPAIPQRPFSVPFDVRVPVAPTAFKGGGKTHLVYELHINNFSRDEWTLMRVEVNGGSQTALAKYEGDDLAGRIARPGSAPTTGAQRMVIGGGLRAVVYSWVTIEGAAPVPATLKHRLTFKVATWPEELTLEIPGVAITPKPITISPPMRGDGWVAANGPANSSGHRRAMILVDGGAHIAQRFAIDWVQLWPEGGTFKGDRLNNKNYRCYGVDALAVTDGVVVAVKDGIPENIPGANSRAVPITLETVGGNHVILDIGGGRYAFYAHLQPGKIPVKVGDKVKRGQVVGLVGNSGNSTEPHLHFHISDANSPLGSDGLPYVFPAFEVLGKGWTWKPTVPAAPVEKRTNEMPMLDDVVRFPARP
jgi:murein DD-endopeptidase